MFERPGTDRLERLEGAKKLQEFIANFAAKYRAEGMPIDSAGRIDMLAYKDLYPDAEEDFKHTREGQADAQALKDEQLVLDGEQLEMLTCSVFAKNLGERYVVARSAPHDDWANRVDTILLDRMTGNAVCAFDEVGATKGDVYESKRTMVQNRNSRQGGASLKYGIGMKSEGGKNEIVRTNAHNLPIFYIALPADRIKKGVEEFLPDPKRQSEFEKTLFTYFIATLSAQVEGLMLYGDQLNGDLKTKLVAFKKILGEFSGVSKK